jgi:hypothetical protein
MDRRTAAHRHCSYSVKRMLFSILAGAAACVFCFPAIAAAGLILDAGLRFAYEDNVVGLLSDQQGGVVSGKNQYNGNRSATLGAYGYGNGNGGYPNSNPTSTASPAFTHSNESPADYSTTLSAEVGWFTSLGRSSTVFIKGFALHQAYGTHTFLDTTQGGMGAGVGTDKAKNIVLNISAFGTMRTFEDKLRNSSAYGGNMALKEHITPSLRFRQFADYELNDADNALFSYSGISGGVGLEYGFSTKTMLTLGCNYLVRKFDEPAGQELRTGTAYFGIDQTIGKDWTVSVEYNHQESRNNLAAMTMRNNVYSVGFRYDY